MRLRKKHWIMLAICSIALLSYQFGIPLLNYMTIKTLETNSEINSN